MKHFAHAAYSIHNGRAWRADAVSVLVWTDVRGRRSPQSEPAVSLISYWYFLTAAADKRATCESRWLGKKHKHCLLLLLLFLLLQGLPLPELVSLRHVNHICPVSTAVQIRAETCLAASKYPNTEADCCPGRPYVAVDVAVLGRKTSLLVSHFQMDFFISW